MSFSNTIPALKQSIIVMVTVNGIILYVMTKPELTTSMFVSFCGIKIRDCSLTTTMMFLYPRKALLYLLL